MDLLPSGDPNAAIFLAVGTTSGELSCTLDTLPLPNGEHMPRLRVVRTDSNYDEYGSKFTIAKRCAIMSGTPYQTEVEIRARRAGRAAWAGAQRAHRQYPW